MPAVPSWTRGPALSRVPVLGLIGVWCGRRLCWHVCTLIGASPPRMQTGERQGSFRAETIWQQAFLVEIYLRIRTAHLPANQGEKKRLKVSLQTQHDHTGSPRIRKCEIIMTHLCFFVLICHRKVAIQEKQNTKSISSLTCSESHSEVP